MDRGTKRKINVQTPKSTSVPEIKQEEEEESDSNDLTSNNGTKQSKPNPIITSRVQEPDSTSTQQQNAQNCQPKSSSTQQNAKTHAIGIDLGTSNIRVGIFRNGKFEIIPNEEGNQSTPSCVAFTDTQRLIGDAAKQQITNISLNTVNDVKRLIGRQFNDPFLEQELKSFLIDFEVINDEMKPKIKVQHKMEAQTFCPEEILSMLLRKFKRDAETYLGESVTDAVIALPGYFSNQQRQAVKDCAAIARLNVLRIVNESTIAALAYEFDKKKSTNEKNVLIFDLGSHNCNVCIVTIAQGVYEAKAANCSIHVAGSNFDTQLVQYFASEFKRKHPQKDLTTNKRSLVRLRAACEQAKMELSTANEAKIELDALFDGIDFHSSISRAQFEDICVSLFGHISEILKFSLQEAKLDVGQIHEIVPIGGSTRIPRIRSLLESFFRGKKLDTSISSVDAVVCGAAFQAASLSGCRFESLQESLLLDITSHSFGIKFPDRTMNLHVVIDRNSTLPATNTITLSTFIDNQRGMSFQVYKKAGMCLSILGNVDITNLPPMPKGVPQIEITFRVDLDYNLQVSTILKIGIQLNQYPMVPNKNGNRLTREQIEQMSIRADSLDADDRQQAAQIEARNSLETFALQLQYAIEKQSQKAIVKVHEILQWLNNESSSDEVQDRDEFTRKRQQLQNECSELLDAVKNVK